MSEPREVRVVVIDDSAYNRQTLTAMLESAPGVKVVARAGDGDEGLRMVFAHQPDVITLDLEMPKMDGYTFLRLLMAKRPTPVIVPPEPSWVTVGGGVIGTAAVVTGLGLLVFILRGTFFD